MRKLRRTPAGLIVTPGASADREHATLVAIEDGLPEITVERLTLGTTSVNNAVAKIRTAAEELAENLNCKPNEIVFGGRSFGGRACSVAVAEGLPAAALVLIASRERRSACCRPACLGRVRSKAHRLAARRLRSTRHRPPPVGGDDPGRRFPAPRD